ncbi:hypothetical protein KXR83_04905 [Williamsia muralis]|uniref:hypothetical protein n=1 Tax=Williamsia marianensis TaxID=85044 RepID=UPI003F163BF6
MTAPMPASDDVPGAAEAARAIRTRLNAARLIIFRLTGDGEGAEFAFADAFADHPHATASALIIPCMHLLETYLDDAQREELVERLQDEVLSLALSLSDVN